MYLELETTVKGGMPTTVCFEVGQPEYDVGNSKYYVDDMWLEVKGKRAEWLEKGLTAADWYALEELALEEYHASQ
jgi:hypothetical protein